MFPKNLKVGFASNLAIIPVEIYTKEILENSCKNPVVRIFSSVFLMKVENNGEKC